MYAAVKARVREENQVLHFVIALVMHFLLNMIACRILSGAHTSIQGRCTLDLADHKEMIMRRFVALFLLAILLTPSTGHTTMWWSGEKLQYTPLPKGYEHCRWEGAADFAFFRDKLLPGISIQRAVTIYTINAAIGCSIAGFFAAKQIENAGAVILGMYIGNAVTDITGLTMDWLTGGKTNPASLYRQAEILETELGISDHYVFGQARCGVANHETFPLGAWVNPKIVPEHERIILLRLSRPEIDYGRLKSRILERNLDGLHVPVTVRKVFGYEVFNGNVIRGPGNRLWPLDMVPDDPQKGATVRGKVFLTAFTDIGHGGIREIHLASPVNQGIAVKRVDDFIAAIVLNRDTVLVRGPVQTPEAGKNLPFNIHIRGLHSGSKTVRMSDGQSYRWERFADVVFHGALCRGCGVTRTTFQHSADKRYTTLYCNPATPGVVELVMKTDEGEVVISEINVVEKRPPTTLPATPQQPVSQGNKPPVPVTKTDCSSYRAKYHTLCMEKGKLFSDRNCAEHKNYSNCRNEVPGCFVPYSGGRPFTDAVCANPARLRCVEGNFGSYLSCLESCNSAWVARQKHYGVCQKECQTKMDADMKKCP